MLRIIPANVSILHAELNHGLSSVMKTCGALQISENLCEVEWSQSLMQLISRKIRN